MSSKVIESDSENLCNGTYHRTICDYKKVNRIKRKAEIANFVLLVNSSCLSYSV